MIILLIKSILHWEKSFECVLIAGCRSKSETWLLVLESWKWKSLGNALVILTLQKAQQVCIHSEINNVGGLEEFHFLTKRELP